MSDISVVLTANNRPEYFEKVLSYWARVHGLPSSMMSCQFETQPDGDAMMNLWRQYFPFSDYHINSEHLGPLGNPHAALDRVFHEDDPDFVILGEDDSIVSEDVLDFFTWAADHYRYDPTVFAVCSFTQHYPNPEPDKVYGRKYFASVVWGTWRDTWDEIIKWDWGFSYDEAWDAKFLRILDEQDLVCIFPETSRSQHIGEHGTHMGPEDFLRLQATQFYEGPIVTVYEEAPCRL